MLCRKILLIVALVGLLPRCLWADSWFVQIARYLGFQKDKVKEELVIRPVKLFTLKVQNGELPTSVALTKNSTLAFLMNESRKVVEISTDGKVVRKIALKNFLGKSLPSQLNLVDLSISKSGKFFVLDNYSGCVLVFDKSGKKIRHFGHFVYATRVDISAQGIVSVRDGSANAVLSYTTAGKLLGQIASATVSTLSSRCGTHPEARVLADKRAYIHTHKVSKKGGRLMTIIDPRDKETSLVEVDFIGYSHSDNLLLVANELSETGKIQSLLWTMSQCGKSSTVSPIKLVSSDDLFDFPRKLILDNKEQRLIGISLLNDGYEINAYALPKFAH